MYLHPTSAYLDPTPDSNSLRTNVLEGSSNDSHTWVLAICMGPLQGVPVSQSQPDPAHGCCRHVGSKPVDKSTLSLFFFSESQAINYQFINQFIDIIVKRSPSCWASFVQTAVVRHIPALRKQPWSWGSVLCSSRLNTVFVICEGRWMKPRGTCLSLESPLLLPALKASHCHP